jgi:hypothetical protein
MADHRPASRSWVRRLAVVLLLAMAVLGGFLVGLFSVTRLPTLASPGYELLAYLANLRGTILFGMTPEPPVEAMAANTFTVRSLQPAANGTILFALRGHQRSTTYPNRLVEVDRSGHVVWQYDVGNMALTDVRRLPNGNTLFVLMDYWDAVRMQRDKSWVVEVDQAGNVVSKISVPVTHHAELLPNGNYLAVSARPNLVTELTRAGAVVWQWDASAAILPYSSETFVGMRNTLTGMPEIRSVYSEVWEGQPLGIGRDTFHLNSAQRLANGNTLVSIRNLDLVAEVDPRGQVVWTYGALAIKHQHCAWELPNSNLLITDNGNARVIEVDRKTQQIVWQYDEGLNMEIQACAYRLPNGNTLITDSGYRRIIEVKPDKSLAWELVVQTPGTQPLYRAWWVPANPGP